MRVRRPRGPTRHRLWDLISADTETPLVMANLMPSESCPRQAGKRKAGRPGGARRPQCQGAPTKDDLRVRSLTPAHAHRPAPLPPGGPRRGPGKDAPPQPQSSVSEQRGQALRLWTGPPPPASRSRNLLWADSQQPGGDTTPFTPSPKPRAPRSPFKTCAADPPASFTLFTEYFVKPSSFPSNSEVGRPFLQRIRE